MIRVAILILVTCAAAAPVRADEGEAAVEVRIAVEAAWLRHPNSSQRLALFDEQTAFAPLVRAGPNLAYGVTNELLVAVGAEVGVAPNVVSNGVGFAAVEQARLFTGAFVDAAFPASAAWQFHVADSARASIELAVGPLFTAWVANVAADPTRLDSSGRPARLPLTIDDAFGFGAFARAGVAVRLRLFDCVCLAMRPYVSVGYAQRPALSLGVEVAPALVTSLLPL